ncbi:hypothetical protein [Hyphococcus sp. DH-69]|uniref:hypothetical protein n=1 Tax=Hyphococcus formosus TaxID=3143534 RepID=UPI00398B8D8B
MKFSKIFAAAGMMAAASFCALFSSASAATVGIETTYRVSSQFDDGTRGAGSPLLVELEYDDTGITGASYTINGYEGAFDSVSISTFSSSSRSAYGQPQSQGVRVEFILSADDNIPLNVDLQVMSLLFATMPGEATPSVPLTEAALVEFFANATTQMATDYRYFVPSANRTRFYVGGFDQFSTFGSDANTGGTTDPVLETPLPASGLLLLGGLGFLGRFMRRRNA